MLVFTFYYCSGINIMPLISNRVTRIAPNTITNANSISTTATA